MAKYKSFEGTVSKAARNGRAFEIDGEWYSIFKTAQLKGQEVEVGDYIKFEYETVEKGGQTFHNIKGDVEVQKGSRGRSSSRSSGGGETSGEEVRRGPTSRDVMIVRQNALSHATALVIAGNMGSLDDAIVDVIATARQLEEYILEEPE